MKPITLEGFADKFAASDDPWSTFQSRDEALKRQAIVHALGPTTRGRVLELAAGNGSNSVALARRSLRLDAAEATEAGTTLVARAIADRSPRARARALRLAVPARFPRPAYDAIVVAELLYYLSPRAMTATARDVAVALRGGGRLVLAHHHVDFYDFVQHATGLQYRFLAETGTRWRVRTMRRTCKWSVLSCTRAGFDPLSEDQT